MRTLALALALTLAGCSGIGEQVPGDGRLVIVHFDESFSANHLPDGHTEAEAVREGLRYWNQLGANLQAEGDTNDFPAATLYVERAAFSWPGLGGAPDEVAWPGLGKVTIYPNVMLARGFSSVDQMRAVVAHGVGHAIGLFHISDLGAMSPSSPWTFAFPSDGDRAEYQRVYSSQR